MSPVAVPDLVSVTSIAAGGNRTCALLVGGTVRCWGENEGAANGLGGVTSITVGAVHTCATLADGTVACWGLNRQGELGDGTTVTTSGIVAVTGLADVLGIASGGSPDEGYGRLRHGHTCAILGGRGLACWGANAYGQVGNGTVANALVPETVAGVAGATAVAAGFDHSCAVLGDGSALCWGAGTYGQLGNGTSADSLTPLQVAL